MKTLVICRVKESVDLRSAVAPHAAAELAALQALKQEGMLLEACSPSGPDVELLELEPFPGFA